MLLSVKLLTKYVIIIYALGSVHKVRCLNQSRSKFALKAKFPAEPGEKIRLSRSKLKQAFLIDSDANVSCT